MPLTTQLLKKFDDEHFDLTQLEMPLTKQFFKEVGDEHLDNAFLDAFENAIF